MSDPARPRRALFLAVALGALATGLAAALPFAIQSQAPTSASAGGARDAAIRDYILRNPEVIEDALVLLQARREVEAQQRQQAQLRALSAQLLATDADPVLGNPDGDVTVVEFFDYRCPYCHRAHEALAEVLAADPNVRVVMKHLPILGPDSILAARAAVAAQAQGAFAPFHDRVMTMTGGLDVPRLLSVAEDLALDMERFARDMGDDSLMAPLDEGRALARQLGIGGTPAFVIGDRLIGGYVPAADLHSAIAAARAADG